MRIDQNVIKTCTLLLAAVMVFISFNKGICQLSSETFNFYSTSEKKEISFSSPAEWETYRYSILQNLQEVMGPLPVGIEAEKVVFQVLDTFETDSYIRMEVILEESRKEKIPVYLYLPKRTSTSGKLPALVALHPTGAEGKKIVDGQGKANRGYAKELAERGYIVIAPDYITFGDLKDFDLDNPQYESGTIAGIYYHMKCIDFLTQLEEVDINRIGAIGHSLGGHNAMFLGAFDPRVKVVVSSCGWTQFENYDIGESAIERYGGRLGPWAQERYMPLIRTKYDLEGDQLPFNFHEVIALLAPRAFFSNSPTGDANFDFKGVEEGISKVKELYSFYRSESQLQVRYPDAGHDFPTSVRRESYEFIDKILSHIPNKHTME